MKQAQDRKYSKYPKVKCVEKRGEEKAGTSMFEKPTSQYLLQVFKVHVLMSKKDIQNPGYRMLISEEELQAQL